MTFLFKSTENLFIVVVSAAVCVALQFPPESPYEESDATAEVHPRIPREERRIPEWSQFFYLRTPDRRDKPRGFSYHVNDRSLHRSGPYPFPIHSERREFPANSRVAHNLEPPQLLRRWHLRDPENGSGRSSESSDESSNVSLEKESESRREEVSDRRPFREQDKNQRSSRITSERERESETQLEEPEPFVDSNLRPTRRDSGNSRWRSVFHKPTPNLKSSKLSEGQNGKEDGHSPFPEGDEVPDIPPGRFPHQGAPYGVVDTYLQFPPISFRFHISPKVHVLRPSDVLVNRPFGNGFIPMVPFENATGPHHLGEGGRVRVHVVAVGHGVNTESPIFPPPRRETHNSKDNANAVTEEVTTSKTSAIVNSLSQQKESNLIEKLTESTTAVTPEITTVITTPPPTTAVETTEVPTTTTTSTTTTETTTVKDTTPAPTTTTTHPTTTEQPSTQASTTEKIMLEIETTLIPETTTTESGDQSKNDGHHTAKTPCDHPHHATTQPTPSSTKISTATSVVETRVDVKTTSDVSEHFESRVSTQKASTDISNGKNDKDNIVFMAAENLELW